MSRNKENFCPPSLTQHFDAPKDYIGDFGLLCGYSADSAFLNDAVERFTRLTSHQRQRQGKISLAIFLDPGNPAISILDMPGVAHLPIKDVTNKPFRLLHAKVALLGFRHQQVENEWLLRLIVSTGNWTRQTLEESLDLVWCIDVASCDLDSNTTLGDGAKQSCADIKAAHELLQWIETLFDTRLLDASPLGGFSDTKSAKARYDKWTHYVSNLRVSRQARVFDNRSSSLLEQLSDKVRYCDNGVKRNYLAMGSGFYETSGNHDHPPEVPVKIIETLKNGGLLTCTPEVDIYVNPSSCQSIATSVEELTRQKMTVRPAKMPSFFNGTTSRSLHAKFLFSAYYQNNSNSCSSAWVYLGSGNLTNPGFVNKMITNAGNLEAGVVFTPEGLLWEGGKNKSVVTNRLPIQWDDDVRNNSIHLSSGSGMEPRDETFTASPVAWLLWHSNDKTCELQTPESSTADFQVINQEGMPCRKTDTGFLWTGSQPRQVHVSWYVDKVSHDATIPVVDQFGRIAATELPMIDVDEAWWQLADFPLPPDDDEDNGGDNKNENYECDADKSALNSNSASSASYPVRQMMALIESIAAKQTEITETDWPLWCNRLEQTLSQAYESSTVSYFRDKLKLNPLSPLWHGPFRPDFAKTSSTQDGSRLYESTLVRIEKTWKVGELSRIGDHS